MPEINRRTFLRHSAIVTSGGLKKHCTIRQLVDGAIVQIFNRETLFLTQRLTMPIITWMRMVIMMITITSFGYNTSR
ncbi:hypothetical protein A4D02_18440 [Niastella koreensis]|uniref:Uncharacterized protein n=2 Tax=Niastella koreensis TaxID=354356 RepID=G8T952_NIAKG|nr:hypothetical protein Niako_0619 [Niastella koreensis GR20-10]OQP39301.1 hypothetical protein A4D02_18440 [Niastella koreensis]